MLSSAVSIVHSTNLLHFGILQMLCVCSLAGQGELHWDGVSHSPGTGLGSVVSHLCHMENGNQKLPPMQKGCGCWEHLLLQSIGMLRGSQSFMDLHSHACFSIPSLFFPQCFRLLTDAKAWSRCACFPFPREAAVPACRSRSGNAAFPRALTGLTHGLERDGGFIFRY